MTQSKSDQSFLDQISKMFEDVIPKEIFDWRPDMKNNFGVYIPTVNIVEKPASFEFEMTAPGREKADFSIKFHDGKLTVSVEKKPLPELKEGERYARKEFVYHPFTRHFNFSRHTVNQDGIKATYKNGILRIVLPKKEKDKTPDEQKIKVS